MMKNISTICLVLVVSISCAQKQASSSQGIPVVGIIKNLSDSALLDVVQKQTFSLFLGLRSSSERNGQGTQ
jgi:hypothetical protein